MFLFELSFDDLSDLLSILDTNILEILAKGLVLIFLVYIYCIVYEFNQICIQVQAFKLFVLGIIINVFDDIIVVLVVWTFLSLVL